MNSEKRKLHSTDQMRKSDAAMDRVLAKSRKMLKQSSKPSRLNTSTDFDSKVSGVLSPKKSQEPNLSFRSSLQLDAYGYDFIRSYVHLIH